jgi:hypothetical protein
MSSEGQFDTEKVPVKTYVPAYQKEEWSDHADELGMSQSEFVRTMVQAGRRQFDVGEKADATDADPGGNGLEDRVLDALDREGPMAFDDLVAALTDDVEERLERTIGTLQDSNDIRHSPRQGYALAEDGR